MDLHVAAQVWAASGAVPPAIGGLALWLRHRERRGRAERVVRAARELPSGSEVEEQFGDGGRLYVRTGPCTGEGRHSAGV